MGLNLFELRSRIANCSWQKLPALLFVLFLAGPVSTVMAQPGRLEVMADKPGAKISPMLYGLMTEEINHSYDGGLYAELIRTAPFKDNRISRSTGPCDQRMAGQRTIALDNPAPGERRADHLPAADVVAATRISASAWRMMVTGESR